MAETPGSAKIPDSRIKTDPKTSGLSQEVILALLTSKNQPNPKDRGKYEKTEHFARVKIAVLELYKTCVLCHSGKNLVVHHRNYRNLFQEHLFEDVILICNRCHGRYHRGHRGRT